MDENITIECWTLNMKADLDPRYAVRDPLLGDGLHGESAIMQGSQWVVPQCGNCASLLPFVPGAAGCLTRTSVFRDASFRNLFSPHSVPTGWGQPFMKLSPCLAR